MRLLLLNPNTSESMTAEIAAAAATVDADPAGAVGAIVDEAAKAVAEDGAEVALAQALVGLGLSTSKAGGYAPGPDNPRSHWPLSTALGLGP